MGVWKGERIGMEGRVRKEEGVSNEGGVLMGKGKGWIEDLGGRKG